MQLTELALARESDQVRFCTVHKLLRRVRANARRHQAISSCASGAFGHTASETIRRSTSCRFDRICSSNLTKSHRQGPHPADFVISSRATLQIEQVLFCVNPVAGDHPGYTRRAAAAQCEI
eukprot:6183493-Pleurochrysis_carterae.AAC.5